jgi:WS/DGAT/MGAT family acyltransferase
LPPAYRGRFHQIYHDFLGARIEHVDMLRRKLAPTALALDHPCWVDDTAFDLEYHLRSMMLPAPGTFAQLEQAVARLHGELLDRDRPLWQFTVIEGLQDGGAALYSKVHHAGLDGNAGMILAMAMYDVSPQPRPKTVQAGAPRPEPPQSTFYGLDTLLVDFLRREVDTLHRVPDLLRGVANLLLPRVPQDAKLGDVFRRDRWPALPPLLAPRTPLNVQVTPERSFAARSLPLAPARRAAKAAGVKLNDIVMGACAGALRRYLHDIDALPKKPLTAFVPVSVRDAGNTAMATQVTGMICSLATDIADPVARLRAIHASSQNAKNIAGELKSGLTGDISCIGAPLVVPALVKLFGKSHIANYARPICNVIISNVPGPAVPLFCAEARVTAMYPVSVVIHGLALNITVQSYMDHLDFGLTGDRRALPDMTLMADRLEESFDELMAAILPGPVAAPEQAPKQAPTPVPEPADEDVRSGVVPLRRKRPGRGQGAQLRAGD